MDRKIHFLHVVHDEKSFDGASASFDSDERIDNRYVLFSRNKNYKFKYIKNIEKVTILFNRKLIAECLEGSNYDVIYFHSLSPTVYKYFRYIPSEKIVIWWGWGYDIYGMIRGMDALIPLKVYMPLTENYKKRNITFLFKMIIGRLLKHYYSKLRVKVLRRIDFFQPVIPTELVSLRLNNKSFSAKEFYSPRSFLSYSRLNMSKIPVSGGSILLGNSANITNNHLDVWMAIQSFVPSQREVIIPLSYGDVNYAKMLHKRIVSSNLRVVMLDKFMRREEFFNLVDRCSYAVFGAIRQQGMGNVYYCLSRNIKVFLFKNSIIYQYLKSFGYCIFSIEDITMDSFRTPLTQIECEKNYRAFSDEFKYRSDIREKAFEELSLLIDNQKKR